MKKELITLFHVEQDKIAIFPNGIDKQLVVDAVNERLKESLQKKYNFRKALLFFQLDELYMKKDFSYLLKQRNYLRKTNRCSIRCGRKRAFTS
ncbi:hypothetical protein AAAC51_00885 [Priestia megaterium]